MNLDLVWKPLVIGYAVLIAAILLNLLANTLNITTWYSLLNNISNQGINVIKKERILSLIFLFIIYPILIGLTAYFTLKLLD